MLGQRAWRGGRTKQVAVAAEAIGLVDVLQKAEAAAELVELLGVLAVRRGDEVGLALQRGPATGAIDVVELAPGQGEELREAGPPTVGGELAELGGEASGTREGRAERSTPSEMP